MRTEPRKEIFKKPPTSQRREVVLKLPSDECEQLLEILVAGCRSIDDEYANQLTTDLTKQIIAGLQ